MDYSIRNNNTNHLYLNHTLSKSFVFLQNSIYEHHSVSHPE